MRTSPTSRVRTRSSRDLRTRGRQAGTFPTIRSRPSRMVSGCGGQPGMKRSTGTTPAAPLWTSGWSTYGPPEMAQAPEAMTIFGGGKRLVGLLQRQPHVLRHRAGDQQPVGVARRGDELDAEAAQVEADGAEHVDVGLAGVAAAGADLPQLERAPGTAGASACRARRARRQASRRPGPGPPALARGQAVVSRVNRMAPCRAGRRTRAQKRHRPRSKRDPAPSPGRIAPVGQTSAQAGSRRRSGEVHLRPPAEAVRQDRRRPRGSGIVRYPCFQRAASALSMDPPLRVAHRSCPQ